MKLVYQFLGWLVAQAIYEHYLEKRVAKYDRKVRRHIMAIGEPSLWEDSCLRSYRKKENLARFDLEELQGDRKA